MRILSVDTSGPSASVAILSGGALIHEISANHGLTHSQTAMPMVDQALSAAGLQPGDIDLYAAVTGPGSFTGVRIGVCLIRGMAHATGRPAVGVNALEALAAGAFGFEGFICPILDARRAQVYGAAFEFSKGARPRRVLPDCALPIDEFLCRLPAEGRLLFTGDGLAVHAQALTDKLGSRAVIAPPHLSGLRAAAAGFLAAQMPDAAGDYRALTPLYLRKPQAEREREARLEGRTHARS